MTIIEITNNDDDHQAYIILAISYMVNRKVFLFFHFFFFVHSLLTRDQNTERFIKHIENREHCFSLLFFFVVTLLDQKTFHGLDTCVYHTFTPLPPLRLNGSTWI